MNGSNSNKRSYSSMSKANNVVRCNGKLKDILSSTPKQKSEGKVIESDLINIPLIKQCDNTRILPNYTSILVKSGDDGVSMDDLDSLQLDLEQLLSTSAVRIRFLLAEIGDIDKNEDGSDRKTSDKTSVKKHRPDEKDKPKSKDLKYGIRGVNKKHYGLSVNKFIGASHQEIPKVTLPKNDNSDKFWASIEPFCGDVTQDHINFLDTLLQEFSKEIDTKIPGLGEHYATTWSDEIVNEEQRLGKPPHKKVEIDIKKNGLQAFVETFSTPQTQKLLSALIEERILHSLPKNGENGTAKKKLKSSEFPKFKTSPNSQKLGVCLDRRLKKELMEQGLINLEDVSKNAPEDEILIEIKKCQQELATVNEYNIEEVTRLKNISLGELKRNSIKEQLEVVDQEILDLYNKIMVTKSTHQEGEDFSEQAIKEFETEADALLRQQSELNRQLLMRRPIQEDRGYSDQNMKDFDSHTDSLLRQVEMR